MSSAPRDHAEETTFYGFAPVPRDPDVLFEGHPTAGGDHPKQLPFTADDFPLPNSALIKEVDAFVQVSKPSARSVRGSQT